MEQEPKLNDYLRILMGEAPPFFLVEVALRTVWLYLLLLFSMRLMGKRMAGQISRVEMGSLSCLAAAVGVPLLDPARGIVPPVLIATLAVGIQQFVAWRATRSPGFDLAMLGRMSILVKDGVLDWDGMKETRISKERVFALLRAQGLQSLGQVERVYLEQGGTFTILPYEKPRPGLSVMPDWDQEFLDRQPKAEGHLACPHCGYVLVPPAAEPAKCPVCLHEEWEPAVAGEAG